MSDFISGVCACSNNKWPTYKDPNCDRLRAELQKIAMTVCGVQVACWQSDAELDLLLANDELIILNNVTGTVNDPTPNVVDDPVSCSPDTITLDYTHSVNFQVPFLKENYAFWNNLRNNPTIGQFSYVDKSGTLYEAPGTPSVQVSYGTINDQIKSIDVTVEWTANDLEEPFCALTTKFAC